MAIDRYENRLIYIVNFTSSFLIRNNYLRHLEFRAVYLESNCNGAGVGNRLLEDFL